MPGSIFGLILKNKIKVESLLSMFESMSDIFKRPLWDACLYMGEATPPVSPDPHFLFAIALQP